MAKTPCDPHATTAAANLLANLRMNNSSEIPLAAWRMMAHAEQKLNKELREYFVPTDAEQDADVPGAGDTIHSVFSGKT